MYHKRFDLKDNLIGFIPLVNGGVKLLFWQQMNESRKRE
jgi:hypothetical protein